METARIVFKQWKDLDISYAYQLWNDEKVVQYIGIKSIDIEPRYYKEIENDQKYNVSYWPIFTQDNQFIGCCGLRPYQDNIYELGFHLLPRYWHQGYGYEAAKAVIEYAFDEMKVKALIAGHHPENKASANLLSKLGFKYIGDKYYEPTGLYHPSYEMKAL